MAETPPDLTRLGDHLEHAVGRAISRRRAQLRAAWALGATVIAAVPMAFAATQLHLRTGDGRVAVGVPAVNEPLSSPDSPVLRPRVLGGDRVRHRRRLAGAGVSDRARGPGVGGRGGTAPA